MSGPEAERGGTPDTPARALGGTAGGDPPSGRLVSLGGLLADLVVRVDAVPARGEDALARGFAQAVGGSFATMSAAARLGMPTALAGVLGDDAIGDAGRAALVVEGIELLLPEPRAGGSGLCLVMVDAGGERTMVTVEGVESRLRAEDLARIELRPGDVVYLSGYELLYPHGPAIVDWIERTSPTSLVFDPGPLVATIPAELLTPILSATTWLSLNAGEAALLGVDGPKSTDIERFSAHQPGVPGGTVAGRRAVVRDGAAGCVVRDGARGCMVRTGGEDVRVPGFVAEVVDTTGAGDTHVGAFVAGLAGGLDPVEAARWGNAAAAHVIASSGQISPPTLGELRAILGAGDD